ncbi:hypothetical protein LA76x_3064 [Lysobacter antibioticus]|uniref:Uncharacterized protein n=1 Tax=Lysobacter antibioticus TaxID=84531 RepID=A0A0S2FCA4_LYSAN|nr:hypothetical protein LA76x_3064 [Lysobacter antibioticus]
MSTVNYAAAMHHRLAHDLALTGHAAPCIAVSSQGSLGVYAEPH